MPRREWTAGLAAGPRRRLSAAAVQDCLDQLDNIPSSNLPDWASAPRRNQFAADVASAVFARALLHRMSPDEVFRNRTKRAGDAAALGFLARAAPGRGQGCRVVALLQGQQRLARLRACFGKRNNRVG